MKKKIITLIIYTIWMSTVAFFSPFIYDWYMELVGDTDGLLYVGLWAVILCFAKIALWGYLAARIADEEIE